MFIHWSEEAIQEIQYRFGPSAQQWRLVFDSEDCGCSVNGVPTFWAINTGELGPLRADSNVYDIGYAPEEAVYFDEQLRVTYHSNTRSFQLASDGQIYTNRLKLIDKR